MQANSSILDGVLEVAEAILDPSIVVLPNFESLGLIIVFAAAAIFLGVSRVLVPKLGLGAAVGFGLALTIAFVSSREAVAMLGGLVILLAWVLKLSAGAALGGLMGRSPAVAFAALASALVAAWTVSHLTIGIGAGGLVALKLMIVVAGGIGTFELLSRADSQGALGPVALLGVSVLVAGVGLVDVNAVGSGPDRGFDDPLQWLLNRAFGVGVGVGFASAVFGGRRLS